MSLNDLFLLARLLAFVALIYGVYLALANADWLAHLIGRHVAGGGRYWRGRLR
jgi:hypothetical protein